ncbi:MAG: T9SS C-terminal target domain-containing protein [Stygiobacter sp.]|nr:MAG: T9SS C-terminal target domain-containing protein [Stygiobacter sp.]
MMALVPAYSKDYKESITIMRNKVKLLKSLPYDSLAFGRKSVMVGVKEAKLIPTEIRLEQNYPNPFNPETAISYQLSAFSFVTLKVYDVLGREVATLVNEHKVSGVYEVKFNRSNLASGIYFYRLTTTTAAITKKMIFSK